VELEDETLATNKTLTTELLVRGAPDLARLREVWQRASAGAVEASEWLRWL